MRPAVPLSIVLICAGLIASRQLSAQTQGADALRGPDAFASISDPAERSRALFAEAAKVITSPRCMNCHPAGDRPTQANDMHEHLPPVFRGDGGFGIAGNSCSTCHTESNYTLHEGASYRSIPGHPRWGMAPIEMAWQGKSVGYICRQIKDPDRNGGRDLKLLHEHLAGDDLVGWAWHPGEGRVPAPGSQQMLGQLIQAWIDTGAQCPQM
jgi:hypothetical protein